MIAFGRRGLGSLADRAQPGPGSAGQRLIRQAEPERLELVEQRDRPQMRVLDQPGGDVVDERGERVRAGVGPHPRFRFTVQ